VSGGCGGIGLAIASRLARAGAIVAVTSRNADHLERARRSNPSIQGFLLCDVTDDASCEAAVKAAAQLGVGAPTPLEAGEGDFCEAADGNSKMLASHPGAKDPRIDLFVHCAGVTMNKLVATSTRKDYHAMFDANTAGGMILARHVIRHGGMLRRSDGCCIAIGSIVGERGNAGQAAYAASKGALTAGWKSMARELAPRNIRCNVVSPGLIESPMTHEMTQHQRDSLIGHGLGRVGVPAEVADVVVLSAQCTFMTGQVLVVDGGASL
jgi:3-oxoacyl-[acyl-carrier protein] reductase